MSFCPCILHPYRTARKCDNISMVMNVFEIVEMTEEYAAEISRWAYPSPYEAYSFKPTEEEIDQLMNGLHAAVTDASGGEETLVGFVAFGWSAQVVCDESEEMYEDESFSDIAFGLKPELCGRGLGLSLVKCGMAFVKGLFPDDGLRLTVRADNARAIKVYERAGFRKERDFTCEGVRYAAMVHAIIVN